MCQAKIYKILKKKGEIKKSELKKRLAGSCNKTAFYKGLSRMNKHNEIKIKDGKVKLNI